MFHLTARAVRGQTFFQLPTAWWQRETIEDQQKKETDIRARQSEINRKRQTPGHAPRKCSGIINGKSRNFPLGLIASSIGQPPLFNSTTRSAAVAD
ncbi:hypothetical protein ElyMa_001813500 [Elysia marginata]|uniref:Uncharacterized protein n=1 Tax=Elysia marginata TaxID=1093978 RepID=A0AAV4EI02_9GAST|nr:hypothetical protein ElyMa_001813500 [Elysia marginata]